MSEVEFLVQDNVAIVTINRPGARNAINLNVAQEIEAALERIESDPDIRVGIVTGAGGNFCAGMDLKGFLKGERPRTAKGGFAGITKAKLKKPMIAAIEGYALAGGFEIALACDLIVVGEGAKVGVPEVKRGLVANAGGLLRLPRQLPERIAAEMVLTGDLYSVRDLAVYGLFNRVVPDGQALAEAQALAGKIAANGPLALAASKHVLRASRLWAEDEMFAQQDAITLPVFDSADAREGAAAFAEKRAPVWRGA
ncbi:Enoyl-CoA hydratase/isomerase [Sphingobium chlorophenolicum L-1]|uniref:Enoyl-CoA hydratase/isomerase n=1 Tax=Sphingobium chlorophenolicum L-1 TaxID=690566 RepID=F6F339_SPHCR|nr:crotonase/enoyl-CoA hydratase family protein [Sphingobium chlorophenolicum]AEG50851.1 Enoyl-CoA hydratase/isomerase [Sphingobium chlorophenolicum L-1]